MNEQDLRIRKTKQALQQALIDKLEVQPFSKTSVKALCEQANVARVTFYKHYRDRDDLLYDVLTAQTLPVEQVPIKTLLSTPFSVFPKIVRAPLIKLLKAQSSDSGFQSVSREYFYNYYMEVFKHTTFKSNLPRELVAYTLVNNAFSFFEWQSTYQVQTTTDEMNRLFGLLVNLKNVY
ncbi:TetR/AcrR family transcriptional regulator [Secundilactobacillus folii]|uniref:TetR family transcriptional regulator n=1 Tax=Secundilactobacillus folii TaxID=2678357 RepID=A0A7X2XV89_9LACO|nr:TetR/AcrR family transcriptional regulator [Secundilactobacillus folii]MTV82264.1 TetR family transcriptional regulator [Secundilactobacillus folii]